MAKRVFDIVFSLIALALFALPMLVMALLIRLGSRGGALFRQRRAGRGGRPFVLLKFRTMRADVDAYGASPHSPDDPRLTRVGRFLRERGLDELPQLLNVLAGRMSLVGPRPLYERQAARWDERQRRRLDVRPGIAGYAQVRGRGAVTHEEKLELDLYYVEHRSFRLDMKILVWTVANLFTRRRDAYERRYSEEKIRETDNESGACNGGG